MNTCHDGGKTVTCYLWQPSRIDTAWWEGWKRVHMNICYEENKKNVSNILRAHVYLSDQLLGFSTLNLVVLGLTYVFDLKY